LVDVVFTTGSSAVDLGDADRQPDVSRQRHIMLSPITITLSATARRRRRAH
jgi:hypothetical protein